MKLGTSAKNLPLQGEKERISPEPLPPWAYAAALDRRKQWNDFVDSLLREILNLPPDSPISEEAILSLEEIRTMINSSLEGDEKLSDLITAMRETRV